MPWLEPLTLESPSARLEPLAQRHCADLREAVKDGELWRLWYTRIPAPDGMAAEIQRRLRLQEAGTMLPFAVIAPESGEAVGMTTYMNVDAENRRVEIGSTWYRKRVQRSALNTACKRLMLGHAFETLNCIAVEFRTSFFNHASRTAIERLGAKLDGVLRNHVLYTNGTPRDTCVYSITAPEWPAVRANLVWRLGNQ